jgi:tetratricopeptide (TPR) repeat protein
MPGTSDKELARSQLVGGQRKAAAVSAQRAVEAAPGDAQAWTLLGLCLEAFERERALAARQKAIIALAPHDAGSHFRIGDFERRRGHYAAAIGAYRVALAAGVQHPVLLNNLGLALQEQGQLDEATRCFRAAARLQPDMAPAHANLGAS